MPAEIAAPFNAGIGRGTFQPRDIVAGSERQGAGKFESNRVVAFARRHFETRAIHDRDLAAAIRDEAARCMNSQTGDWEIGFGVLKRVENPETTLSRDVPALSPSRPRAGVFP
jgi:hypothetical protein